MITIFVDTQKEEGIRMVVKIVFTVLFTVLFGALMILDFDWEDLDSWLRELAYIAYLVACLWLVWGIS